MVQCSCRNDSFADVVLDVLLKLVNTFAVLLADEGISESQKSLAGLLRVHRLFLALTHEYPSIKTKALHKLRKFVSDEKHCTKTSCPTLGLILPLLMVVDEQDYGWSNLPPAYTKSFDPAVLWTCKMYPQLENTQDELEMSPEKAEKRVALTLNAMTVSLRLCMIHVYFYRATCSGTTSQERATRYDRFFGQPDPEENSSASIMHSIDTMRAHGGTHTIHLNLGALANAITCCIFVISAWQDATLNDFLSTSISFFNADAGEGSLPLCTYVLEAHDKVSYLTSVIMCKLHRTREGGWHVQAIGDSHKGAADNYAPIHLAAGKLV